jgi:Protein of unknown function (DUF3011)
LSTSYLIPISICTILFVPTNGMAKDYVKKECQSWNYVYKECPIGRRAYDIYKYHQFSKAPCEKGSTYGINSNGNLFVSHGCRGSFEVYFKKQDAGTPPTDQYYVIGRYYCDDDKGKDAGDCTVTTRGNSCQAALGRQQEVLSRAGDICQNCNNINDRFKHYRNQMQYIQGGPCQNNP